MEAQKFSCASLLMGKLKVCTIDGPFSPPVMASFSWRQSERRAGRTFLRIRVDSDIQIHDLASILAYRLEICRSEYSADSGDGAASDSPTSLCERVEYEFRLSSTEFCEKK